MEYDDPKLFDGIRFFLAGYSPDTLEEVKSKIVSKGGVYVAKYSPDCTHVIVHDLLLDDPICVAARRDKKKLLSSIWVDHSLDAAMLLDVYHIMYRPLRDLNGIPGAEELVICLTGYPRYLREDIMTMTSLMGAQFSKALVPQKITHLVCYKFEGEKYDVGKKLPRVKLVNHQWLEDCLKAWKIMPEEHYVMSGAEYEMMEAEVHDSEDEAKDTTEVGTDHRAVNGIPTVFDDYERTFDKPMISVKAEISSVQGPSNHQGPEGPEQVLEPRNEHNADKQSPMFQNNDEQTVRKTPAEPSRSLDIFEDLANLSGPNSKWSADVSTDHPSPLNSRKTPKSSKTSNGPSNGIAKGQLESDAMRNSILEVDRVEVAASSGDTINSKRVSKVDADKHSPLSSRKSVSKPSLPFQSEATVTIHEGRMQEELTEKVVRDVGACITEPDMISAKKFIDVSNNKTALPDGEDLFTVRHTKELVGEPDDFGINPGLQKLITSSSKRINAMDPITSVSSSRKESVIGSLNISGHAVSETTRASTDKSSAEVPSVKSNFAKLQVGKSTNVDIPTSPISGSVASSGVKNKNDEPHDLPKNVSYSLELKKLVASHSGNMALNSDDQIRTSTSNPPRKKTIARKTLGSRPKVSKKTADDQNCSPSKNISGLNAPFHLAGQISKNDPPNSSVTEKLMGSHSAGQLTKNDPPNSVEGKGFQGFVSDINDCTKPSNDDANDAEVTDLPCDNINEPKMPEAKSKATEHHKQSLAPKKVISKGAKVNVSCAATEIIEDVCEAREQIGRTLAATGKKRQGDHVLKGPVSSKDPATCNDSKGVSLLVSKKRRGTLLLNRRDTLLELEKEIESGVNKGGQHDVDIQPDKLAVTSKLTNLLMETENGSDPSGSNSQCTDNDVKHAGKKRRGRRGTLILSKPEGPLSEHKVNLPLNDSTIGDDQSGNKGKKIAGKKRRGTLLLSKARETVETDKENVPVSPEHEETSEVEPLKSDPAAKMDVAVSLDAFSLKSNSTPIRHEPACFIVSGHRLQRKEFHQVIKRLKGKHCRDSHHWSYQATHFIVPDPIRRTEKFFAAAASGRWILKTDYLTASIQAEKLLPEEPYEWHKNGLTEDNTIDLEAPRKWRLLREKTGHGAFYGMNIVVYGECIAPSLDTLKRAVRAGDGTILATSPPYTRFLKSGLDYAIVSPGITRADKWVQEFLSHEIPCVSADYLVEYVCKPGHPLDRHVHYNTHEWAARSFTKLSDLSLESVADAGTPENQGTDNLACQICGLTDREEVMLVCGDERGFIGCGIGTHIDCCDPPLKEVPGEDWFCPQCTQSTTTPSETKGKKSVSKKRK